MTHFVSYRSRGSVDARGSNPRLKGFDYASDGSENRGDGAAVVGEWERCVGAGLCVGCGFVCGWVSSVYGLFCVLMGGLCVCWLVVGDGLCLWVGCVCLWLYVVCECLWLCVSR